MTVNYSGPLFQLNNGTTTLDIGQTTSHKADMTTWSAFCSGVASNCKISKIYAQIQGSANDLTPSTYFNAGCSAGGLTCAAVFQIETATGLPVIEAGFSTADFTKGGCCYTRLPGSGSYLISGDVPATGINGGTTATSVWLSSTVLDHATCCGVFGISHASTAPDTPGTDFLLFTDIANNYPPDTASCTAGHCVGVDVEAFISPTNSYTATVGDNANYLVTWDGTSGAGTNTFCNYYNGTQLGCAPATTSGQNTPTSVHLGAGGDDSDPAPVMFRSGFIANSVVSSTVAAALKANEAAFYGIPYN
jgi:hypothetical protein